MGICYLADGSKVLLSCRHFKVTSMIGIVVEIFVILGFVVWLVWITNSIIDLKNEK